MLLRSFLFLLASHHVGNYFLALFFILFYLTFVPFLPELLVTEFDFFFFLLKKNFHCSHSSLLI